jgi:signal transduction histidine kinase
VNQRLARVLAVGVLIACVASLVTASGLFLAAGDRIPRGKIVVVGDLSTPGMQEVLDELQHRVEQGEDLAGSSSGGIPAIAPLVFILLVWVGIGALIVFRQPANWAGWLFLITGMPFPLLSLAQAVMVYGLKVEPGSIPFIPAWATAGEFALYPLSLVPLLFLLYPDGRLPGPRWRWSVVGLVGGTAVAFLGFLLRPGPFNNWREDGIVFENPFGVRAFASGAGVVIAVGTIIALISSLSAVIAIVLRFRRSTGEARQQMRLLAFVGALAGTFVALMFVLGFIAEALAIGEELAVFPIMFGLAAFTIVIGVPAAYLIAILRHRLWDLDVVIKKTVIFGIVAGGLTLLLLLVVLLLPAAVLGTGFGTELSGGERALLLVGLALGLLIGPLRRRARRFADRIVYGGRATPYEVLSAFGERVGETYSTEDVLPRMVRLLAEATGAETATVWIRVGGDLVAEAGHPSLESGRRLPARSDAIPPIEGEHAAEVRHQGELLGALSVQMPANDPMNPKKEKLIADLAAQAGLVLRNVRLIEELRASRQRLVAAQDEERRKIERNLHDGAQQQLVALAVQLKLARTMIDRDPPKAGQMLEVLQSSATEAIEDLRDLARGIYPPLLADKGLEAALEAQARKSPIPVLVETDAIGRYPRDVESAIYFCALESLNNVAKYADATRAVVRLAGSDGHLTFTVTDDGQGFDPDAAGHGTGLQGMADRLDAIGGTFDVTSAPGSGTTVTGRVPIDGGASR